MMSAVSIMKSREDLQAEAAEWVVRLGAESATDEDRAACVKWKGQSAAHQAAFDYADRTWRHLAMLDATPVAVQSLAIQPHTRRSRRVQWLGLAACFAGLAIVLFLQFDALRTMVMADYRTGSGEQRQISLPDGSTVFLNTASAIALRFDDHARRVELLSGEALFVAAPKQGSESRPFVVTGGEGSVRALGTQFIVRRFEHADELTVIEHSVEVSVDRHTQAAAPVIVEAGQRVRYDGRSGPGSVADVNIEQVTSWQRGRLLFDRMPLAEVIAEINRYRRGRIVIMNSDLATRRVSGVVMIDKVDDSLSIIASELGARTASLTSYLTLLY
ncbi:sensor [Nitrospira sp. KM1]|uniref:FecR family protein n=1 Tax=Nitrospira sp. KM1 TaxID=1936990 RepID=UPI0013A76CF8|nr:FecR family protein [Nitrospira sp. KM1]BCA56603.1 sensor [Nitrospira sp. KM1]